MVQVNRRGDWEVSACGEDVGIAAGPPNWGMVKGLFSPEEARLIAKTILRFADQAEGVSTSDAPEETPSPREEPKDDYWSMSLPQLLRQSR